jgi:hypothetical protein
MSDDYTDRIERFLEQHHITAYRFEHRSKHRAVIVTHGSREITVIFPFSRSDWRGSRNCVSSLRRVLGMIGEAP